MSPSKADSPPADPESCAASCRRALSRADVKALPSPALLSLPGYIGTLGLPDFFALPWLVHSAGTGLLHSTLIPLPSYRLYLVDSFINPIDPCHYVVDVFRHIPSSLFTLNAHPDRRPWQPDQAHPSPSGLCRKGQSR